jgi:4a-hydroxytetrahydrobiopterin dehydratase
MIMDKLANQPILSYSKYDEPLTEEQTEDFLKVLPDWKIVYYEGNPRLEKSFSFDDFMGAVEFANQIADLSEEAHHHPDITISWGKCLVSWWTFVYKRLHENDFIMAARTEKLYQEQ